MSLRLIVHADDFGLSHAANSGIVRAFNEGILTSTSVMPTGRAYEQGVRQLSEVDDLDLGIHLTLVEERPVSAPDSITTLVQGNGTLHSNSRHFANRYVRGAIDINEVRVELEAQIVKALNDGLAVSHLDSHQHALSL